MHDDEFDIDSGRVTRLIAHQFPDYTERPIEPELSAGTDNARYRLGDALAVGLPRIAWAVADVKKEQRWLPRLAPVLPVAIPVPAALGAPAEGYPWPWSVYRWLEGENPTVDSLANPAGPATEVAGS
jgi:aminoglycoside phosphotransferase (APT) family kinase protein